ncbi:MAG: hypothetical protein U0414_30955 [Polyangiaceae bacterium]
MTLVDRSARPSLSTRIASALALSVALAACDKPSTPAAASAVPSSEAAAGAGTASGAAFGSKAIPGGKSTDKPTLFGAAGKSLGGGRASAAGASGTSGAGDAPPTKDVPAGMVDPGKLSFKEMKVEAEDATGDDSQDAWRYFKLWGEFRNDSTEVVDEIVADIRYFDAAGKELGIDSISSATKKDIGDDTPGEPIRSAVSFIQPGASVPVTHIRSVNKLKGKYASYTVTIRAARAVSSYPRGVLEGKTDTVAEVANENLENASPHEHRVIGGTLKNDGTVACRNPGLVVAYYDGGKLRDLSEGDAKVDAIAPGASAPVRVFTLVGFDDAWKAKAEVKLFPRCSQ